MPGFIAKELCPELIFIPCNFQKYKAVSHVMKEIVAEYDPTYISMGLDEVNLDVTEVLKAREMFSDA